MDINNANNPSYVPQYATWRGETVRNTNGLTQEVLLRRKLSLEVNARSDPSGRLMNSHINQINAMRLNAQSIGNAARSGISIGTPTAAMETLNGRRIDAIRQLMAEQEEGSLAMDILGGMLEQAQSPQSNAPTNIRYAVRPSGGFDATV
ncbi:MAG: hypothetical protein FWB96_12065 [Defluviitaleaceae bacterium]|nr:hypothetical protein [Defluviitaleaceae bacterium]MCL2263150.1 hypothetical protein [Defluviitaleaceae bacterium]